MKLRLISVAAATTLIATLGLTACSSDPASADCLKVSSGSVSDAVKTEGELGGTVTISADSALKPTGLQRTVVTRGTGEVPATGQSVDALVSIYNGLTYESVYAASQTLIAGDNTLVDSIRAGVDCLPAGSRSVSVMPASDLYQSDVLTSLGLKPTDPVVAVIDVMSVVPEPTVSDWTTGVPKVTFDATGQPVIDLAGTTAPKDIAISVLKEGTGETVKVSDTVKVNYYGVDWADGTSFDSNWGEDPTEFALTGVIAGFRLGLTGQKVGSQLLVSIPAAYAYGEGTASEQNPMAGKNLLFLIDIVSITPAAK